jgi:RNA polymerase sigma-70 factor (ECF subfamily)
MKSWLLTTLRRLFLGRRRHATRFPHLEISTVEHDLPRVDPEAVDRMDVETIMEALMQTDEPYRSALMLFYFEDFSYKDIAKILGVPAGTVMSRLARGKMQIRRVLARETREDSVDAGNASPVETPDPLK